MPPSPVLRYSPGREMRTDNHKRGRSLEGGLLIRGKDDDLALFNEVQSRERENFLVQSTDDFGDTFSTKLRQFSDIKLGISIPSRGEGSDLLNADGEKNDYDWLLTPPDTPLFPTLDDEPIPVNIVNRGRPQSKPISISRSSTMERSQKSSRGSASPNRLSSSPCSSSNTFQSRGRPSSAPHSSPTPSIRYATPPERQSPPPSKPSTVAPRCSTPTPRRMSTGSTSALSSGIRGTSPVKTSRGNSASPKIRAWQATIPGFSSEAPPNLRTSLADRPASYVRGSSPASRNSRDSTSKVGRQSISPSASRSGSSYSHDRDRFSSYSKGSIASSGDDDIDSLQSVTVGSLDRMSSRKIGTHSNNRPILYSIKSAQIVSSSSTPKRSFDSALQQTDQRKSPHNMFRPLLSSVPSTTFYAGTANFTHRSLVSRNSSVTMSSNASSDQGAFVLESEGGEHNRNNMVSESEKMYSDLHEELYDFARVDIANERVTHSMDDRSFVIQQVELSGREHEIDYRPVVDSENYASHLITAKIKKSENSHVKGENYEFSGHGNAKICSKCDQYYDSIVEEQNDLGLCPECCRENSLSVISVPLTTSIIGEDSAALSTNIAVIEECLIESKPPMVVSKMHENLAMDQIWFASGRQNAEERQSPTSELILDTSHGNPLPKSLREDEEAVTIQPEQGQPYFIFSSPPNNSGSPLPHHPKNESNLKIDSSEGTGISVLLKQSGSSKGPVVQGRFLTATTSPFDELSLTRDSSSSMGGSTIHGSLSASSSVDFSSSRPTDTHVPQQLSSRKLDLDCHGYIASLKSQSCSSSFSGTSTHSLPELGVSTSIHRKSFDHKENNNADETNGSSRELLASECVACNVADTSLCLINFEEEKLDPDINRTICSCKEQSSSQSVCIHCEDNSVASITTHDDASLYEDGHDHSHKDIRDLDAEESAMLPIPSLGEECNLEIIDVEGRDGVVFTTNNSSITELEIEKESLSRSDSDELNDNLILESGNIINECQESAAQNTAIGDLTAVPESNTSLASHGILEESIVTVDCQDGNKGRSLTLEEATDAILFCSSIVHDLAYQAATIAIRKENLSPLEESRPMVTILGKSNSNSKDSRNAVIKRNVKSRKASQTQIETDLNLPSGKTENDENVDQHLTRNIGLPNKTDSLKPPKLESKCNCNIM